MLAAHLAIEVLQNQAALAKLGVSLKFVDGAVEMPLHSDFQRYFQLFCLMLDFIGYPIISRLQDYEFPGV